MGDSGHGDRGWGYRPGIPPAMALSVSPKYLVVRLVLDKTGEMPSFLTPGIPAFVSVVLLVSGRLGDVSTSSVSDPFFGCGPGGRAVLAARASRPLLGFSWPCISKKGRIPNPLR